jgi:integrase
MNQNDINKFLSEKKLNNVFNSDNTTRAYKNKLIAWLKFSNGKDDTETAKKYLEFLVAVYDSKSVKATLYILKSFYDWLGTDPNPFLKIVTQFQINKKETAQKRLKREGYVYSDSDVKDLLTTAKQIADSKPKDMIDYYLAYRNWFVIIMMSEFGMRIGGLMGTDVDHINFERRLMTIFDSKNGQPYPVPIKSIQSDLRGYLNIRNTLMKDVSRETKALFLSNTGKRLSDTSARRSVNAIAEEIGLYDAGRSTHQLRHYRATKYYKEGMPLDLISQIMGVSVGVLKRTYLHLTDDDTIRQYESWLESKKTESDFKCPRCGYSKESIIETKKPKLEVVK